MKLRIRTTAIVVAALMALLAVTVVSAKNQWAKYKWVSDTPVVTLEIGSNVTSEWDTSLTTSIADWNGSANLSLSEKTGAITGSVADCNPKSGRVEVCNSYFGKNGWLGIAQVWLAKGKNITRANAIMNDYYFTVEIPAAEVNDWRQMVMCQEIGHDFGLDHQDETFGNANLGTCMDYTDFPLGDPELAGDLRNLHPNQHDFDQLASMYDKKAKGGGGNGGGGNNGGGGGPPPGKGPNRFAPLSGGNSEFGRAIGQDASGRDNKFERDLGNGKTVLTHVLWAN